MSTAPCPAALASATPLQGSLPREPQPSPGTLRVDVLALSQGQKKEVRGDVRRWHGGDG